MFEKIPENIWEGSGECYQRFWGMLLETRGMLPKIPGNTQENSGESKFRFILWNAAYF